MSPEVSSGNESDLKTGPVLALIGAEEHIASHHNVVSPGVIQDIVVGNFGRGIELY